MISLNIASWVPLPKKYVLFVRRSKIPVKLLIFDEDAMKFNKRHKSGSKKLILHLADELMNVFYFGK